MSSVVITNCIPELIALLGLASTDETCPVIMCVRFEVSTQRTLAIATDGRRLGVLDCGASLQQGEDAFTTHVSAAELAALLKTARKWHQFPGEVEVYVSAESVSVRYNRCTILIQSCALSYPAWRDVLSSPVPAVACTTFNPELAGDFADCDPVGVTATALRAGSQIYIHGESGRFFGVLMPVRRKEGHSIEHKVPAWIGGVA